LKKIEAELENFKHVQDIDFPIRLIEIVNKRSWAFWQVAIILGVILSFGAYLLILNTVRLDIYSKRLTIRSMQLIGATRNYIRKPFVNLGVIQGAIGGLNATLLIVFLLMFISVFVIDLDVIFKSKELYMLFAFLIIFGSVLGYISSHRAVNRYLDKHLDEII
jgi:cell division transport system permease protein